MGITIEQKDSDGNVTNVQPYTTVFSDMEPIIKNLRKLATKYKKKLQLVKQVKTLECNSIRASNR